MKHYDVYALGNALVDLEFAVSDTFLQKYDLSKGMMSLMDLQQRARLLSALEAGCDCIKRTPGGSAANSAYTLAGFGGRAFYSCRIANDDTGHYFRTSLNQAGIGFNDNCIVNQGHTGTCLVLVTPDAERTMQTYLGVTSDVGPDDLDAQALTHSKWLYLEGYLAPSPSARAAAHQARTLAKAAHVPTALSCSDPSMARFFRTELLDLIGEGVDMLFCNAEEACLLADCEDLRQAATQLGALTRELIITLGAEGALIVTNDQIYNIAPFLVKPIDTNGAGDAFAGSYLYGRTHEMSPEASGQLAARTSAEIVCQFGARLAFERYHELLREHHTNQQFKD